MALIAERRSLIIRNVSSTYTIDREDVSGFASAPCGQNGEYRQLLVALNGGAVIRAQATVTKRIDAERVWAAMIFVGVIMVVGIATQLGSQAVIRRGRL